MCGAGPIMGATNTFFLFAYLFQMFGAEAFICNTIIVSLKLKGIFFIYVTAAVVVLSP